MTNEIRVGQIWMSGSKRWYVIDRAPEDQFVLAVTVNDEWVGAITEGAAFLLESQAITLSHYSTKDVLLMSLLRDKANQAEATRSFAQRFARRVEDIFYYHAMTREQRGRLQDAFDDFGMSKDVGLHP